MNITLLQGDCRDMLKTIPDNSVDSVVTDPPYELGFMGKVWDNTGIAYNPQVWQQVFRVLKPGGYLLSFGGTRTYHRMAIAIENAGFEIRDMVEWVYGSGFPKSLNIGKAVDKLQGNKREKIIVPSKSGNSIRRGKGEQGSTYGDAHGGFTDIAKGTSPWEGWGTALKPAHEPICMARKPLSEKTVAENVLKHGTGGINIDGSRVEYKSESDKNGAKWGNQTGNINDYGKGVGSMGGKDILANNFGRFPANLIHDGSEEVMGMFPETKPSKKRPPTGKPLFSTQGNAVVWNKNSVMDTTERGINDSGGSAARFFYCAKASKEERNRGCEDKEEKRDADRENDSMALSNRLHNKTNLKNNHPTVKPIALMKYLINLVTPPNGTVLDPFMGSGSTGVAAKDNGFNFIGIELNKDYIEIAQKRIESVADKLL